MATKLTPKITKVALVDAGANPDADFVFYKAAEPLTETEAIVADDIQKNLDEVTADRDAMKAELDALTSMDNDTLAALRGIEVVKADEAEINKADLPEAVQKRLDEASALEVRVAKMEADARVESFTKRAATDFAKVADHAELGAVLATIAEKAPEVLEGVEKVLRAANERIDTSTILKTVGSDGDADASDPVAAKVDAILKADPNKSKVDATAEAMRDPEIQKAWAEAAK